MSGILSEIRAFAGTFAPRDWRLCDGLTLKIIEYEALYSILGITFGGDGRTEFKLPDLRGRVIVSTGTAPESDAFNFVLGQQGGKEAVSLETPNTPPHKHLFSTIRAAGETDQPDGNYYGVFKDLGSTQYPIKAYLPNTYGTDPSQLKVPFHAEVVEPSGHPIPQPHENRQPFMTINYIICVTGMYPAFE